MVIAAKGRTLLRVSKYPLDRTTGLGVLGVIEPRKTTAWSPNVRVNESMFDKIGQAGKRFRILIIQMIMHVKIAE
jgi:hypothetical protein